MKGSDKTQAAGTSLIVQWLRLGTPKAGTPGLVPGQGTRFHMLQLGACMPQLKKKITQKTPNPSWCFLYISYWHTHMPWAISVFRVGFSYFTTNSMWPQSSWDRTWQAAKEWSRIERSRFFPKAARGELALRDDKVALSLMTLSLSLMTIYLSKGGSAEKTALPQSLMTRSSV